jgi:hypothetical protein
MNGSFAAGVESQGLLPNFERELKDASACVPEVKRSQAYKDLYLLSIT